MLAIRGANASRSGCCWFALALVCRWRCGATQYVARQYGYHASLGEPVVGSFYWPWSFVIWSLKWGHAHTELFQWAYVIAMVGIAAAFGVYLVANADGAQGLFHEALHGTAHWATAPEIADAGLSPRLRTATGGVCRGLRRW